MRERNKICIQNRQKSMTKTKNRQKSSADACGQRKRKHILFFKHFTFHTFSPKALGDDSLA